MEGGGDNRVGGVCLICRSTNLGEIITAGSKPTIFQNHCSSSIPVLSKHLRIYFLLRHVFELPSEQLESYLKDFPNPENWVKICSECETNYVEKCERIFVELLEVRRRFAGAKLELIGAIKRSTRGELRLSKKANTENDDKTRSPHAVSSVDLETRRFVEENDYAPPSSDIFPFIDGDSLAEAKYGSLEELRHEPKPDTAYLSIPSTPSEETIISKASPNEDDDDCAGAKDIKEEPASPKCIAIDADEVPATSANRPQREDNPADFSIDRRSPSENGDPNSGEDWTPDEMSDSSDEDFQEMKTASLKRYHFRGRKDTITIPNNPKKNLKITSLSIKRNYKALRSLTLDQNQRECDLCVKTFKTRQGLLAHKAFTHRAKTYKCSKCDWKGKPKFMLQRHMARWHGTSEDLKALTCSTCKKIVKSKHALKLHLIGCQKDKLVCEHCGKEFHHSQNPAYLCHLTTKHQVVTDHLKFRCSFEGCDKSFYTMNLLKQHETHHKPPELECSICGAKFHMKAGLKRHIRRHSSKQLKRPKSYKCSECELSFAWKRMLDSHLAKVHSKSEIINDANFKCSQCPLQFRKSDLLRLHLMTIHKVFECSECDWKGNTRAYLQTHLKTEHNKDLQRKVRKPRPPSSLNSHHDKSEGYRCEPCGKKYKNWSSFWSHNRLKHDLNRSGIYKCSFENCGRSFPSKPQLTDHEEIHKAPRHKCDICGTVYSQASSLLNHLKKFHENPTGEVKKRRRIINSNCDLCNLVFCQRKQFQKHMKEVHGVEERNEEPESRHHQCSICGIICTSRPGLQNHIDIVHDRKLDVCCDLCGKIFNGNALKMHKMAVHNVGVGDRHRLQCTVESCTREFWTECHMKSHVRRVHEKERPFQCGECGKKLGSKQYLNRHMEAMHRNKESKPFKCEVCGRGFAIKNYLSSHMRKKHGKV